MTVEQTAVEVQAVAPNIGAAEHEQTLFTDRLRNLGKQALVGATVTLAIAAPFGAGAEAVIHNPSTHVPMQIAGADVTARIEPGSNVDSFSLLETTFTGKSDQHIGRKDFGVAVNFDFSKTKGGDSNTLKNLLAQFSDTKAQRREISNALERSAKRHFAEGASAMLLLELGAGGYMLARRRKYAQMSPEATLLIRDDRRLQLRAGYSALVASALLATVLPAAHYLAPNHPRTIVADPHLAGTPLEGMEATGLYKPVFDAVIPNIAPLLREKNAYIHNAGVNIDKAFKTAHPDGLTKDPDTYTLVLADDFQGIDVTTGALGKLAHLYKANAILVAGDTMETGTKFETNVVDGLAYVHDKYKVPIALATGRHDSYSVLSRMAKDRGLIMANGKVQEVGGIRVLGVNEAHQDLPGFPSKLVEPGVTDADKVTDALKTLCALPADKPVVYFAHDSKQLGQPVAESECAPIVATGRHIIPQGPVNYDNRTTWNVLSSSGGHTPTGFDVFGLPQSTVSFQVITFKKNTYHQLTSEVITLSPDVEAKTTIEPVTTIEQLTATIGTPLRPANSAVVQADGPKS